MTQRLLSAVSQNLPKLLLSAIQVRTVAAMDIAQIIAPIDSESKVDEAIDKSKKVISNKNNTRFAYRQKHKRQWEEPSNAQDSEANAKKRLRNDAGEVVKRKKMALLLGYCGVDYYGMQRNPGVKTIEEDLLKALLDAKYITEDDYNNQQEAQFQRSSRTDKGVSAARQVVSLKLPLDIDIQEVNKRLPSCIKVFGLRRVTNKFNSKVNSNARTYSYLLPTAAFDASVKTKEERIKFRITADQLSEISKVLDCYKGTNTYYNFTEKKSFTDPSSLRYIMNVNIERVFVHSEMEFAEMLIKGQSFMLHQIRKMVGLALAVIRGHCSVDLMKKAFTQEKLRIPTAPGLGLVLDQVHYERYNEKHKETHTALSWQDEEEEVQRFKLEHIYPVIIKGEVEGNSMFEWLEKLEYHSFDPNVEMVNPEEANAKSETSDPDNHSHSDGNDIETSKTAENGEGTNDVKDDSKTDFRSADCASAETNLTSPVNENSEDQTDSSKVNDKFS